MKYVSPEEGFSVKVSYGKNLIHNSKIQGKYNIHLSAYFVYLYFIALGLSKRNSIRHVEFLKKVARL